MKDSEIGDLLREFDALRASEEAVKTDLRQRIYDLVWRFCPRQGEGPRRVLTTNGDYYLMLAFQRLGLPDPLLENEAYLHWPGLAEHLPHEGEEA